MEGRHVESGRRLMSGHLAPRLPLPAFSLSIQQRSPVPSLRLPSLQQPSNPWRDMGPEAGVPPQRGGEPQEQDQLLQREYRRRASAESSQQAG